MTDARSFLEAILAEPDDDNVRAVYADWLDEQAAEAHEPTPTPRAEFIRLQLAIARALAEEPAGEDPVRCIGRRLGFHKESAFLAAFIGDRVCDCILCLQKRERELYQELDFWAEMRGVHQTMRPGAGLCTGHADRPRWRLRYGNGDNDIWFEMARGFVDRIELCAADWLLYADALLSAHPIRKVTLTTRPNWMIRRDLVWLHDGNFEAGAARACRNVTTADQVASLEWKITYLKGLFLAEWPRIEFEVPPDRPVTQGDFDAITRDILADCMSRWSFPAHIIEPRSIVFPRNV